MHPQCTEPRFASQCPCRALGIYLLPLFMRDCLLCSVACYLPLCPCSSFSTESLSFIISYACLESSPPSVASTQAKPAIVSLPLASAPLARLVLLLARSCLIDIINRRTNWATAQSSKGCALHSMQRAVMPLPLRWSLAQNDQPCWHSSVSFLGIIAHRLSAEFNPARTNCQCLAMARSIRETYFGGLTRLNTE